MDFWSRRRPQILPYGRFFADVSLVLRRYKRGIRKVPNGLLRDIIKFARRSRCQQRSATLVDDIADCRCGIASDIPDSLGSLRTLAQQAHQIEVVLALLDSLIA